MQASLVPLSQFYSFLSLLAPLLAAIFLEGLGRTESVLYVLIYGLLAWKLKALCLI